MKRTALGGIVSVNISVPYDRSFEERRWQWNGGPNSDLRWIDTDGRTQQENGKEVVERLKRRDATLYLGSGS